MIDNAKLQTRHLPHYFSLVGILLVSVLGFLFFSYDRDFQIAILFSVAISYVVWGVVHHKLNDDFYPSVLFEYVAVAFLGVAVVLSLLLGF